MSDIYAFYFVSQITVLADLPVGNNLQDHVFTDNPIFEVDEGFGIDIDKAKSMMSVLDYYIFGQGLCVDCFMSSTFYRVAGRI